MEQNPQVVRQFDHLKQLRHFLAEKRRGTLLITTDYGPVELDFSQGLFLTQSDDSAVIQAINMLLMCQVLDLSVEELKTGNLKIVSKAPEEIIIRACYRGTMDETRIFELSRYFSMFPPVKIRLAPIHRFAEIFPGFINYMQLHTESLINGQVNLNDFIMSSDSPEKLNLNVRLLVVLYVLGLIVPIAKPRRSIFGRIMKAVRGI